MEESKAHASDFCVRYALSAFEDLNSAIRNLRRCFGFPYQEYIGYLNTLSRSHRARREHEHLIDRFRRWAIFGNVDAVFWIDYAKANQPPGSFKMGPLNSRPFSTAHMEICAHGLTGGSGKQDNDDDSDAPWSEPDDEVGGPVDLHDTGGPRRPASKRPTFLPHRTRRGAPTPRGRGGAARMPTVLLSQPAGAATSASGGATASRSGGAPRLAETGPSSARASGPESTLLPKEENSSFLSARHTETKLSLSSRHLLLSQEREQQFVRSMLQEEFIPAHGSIYKRTITPGPGYYSISSFADPPEGELEEGSGPGPSFTRRPPSTIDEAVSIRELPGPGDYRAKAQLSEMKAPFGRFGRAEKLVSPLDISKKLPFISRHAAMAESHGVHGSGVFHEVIPEGPYDPKNNLSSPKFSFGKLRRPF
eukprot:CAMPEP_0168447426 /NCGR_PEP_ID=MMETSP0228-20121227/46582_1 /TAXON_ID=133427 /ORGANISM="Protoceratium reticulatum, Strain CCCM 535 (=CCMP 1889)" /LENGTH=420 /DNA_ID=CAMNT_0008461947 /DNA_START=123 /DNA_END=1385 /DNA_ORIENTATION=+